MNSALELGILELGLVPHFILNCKFRFVGPNLLKKHITV